MIQTTKCIAKQKYYRGIDIYISRKVCNESTLNIQPHKLIPDYNFEEIITQEKLILQSNSKELYYYY